VRRSRRHVGYHQHSPGNQRVGIDDVIQVLESLHVDPEHIGDSLQAIADLDRVKETTPRDSLASGRTASGRCSLPGRASTGDGKMAFSAARPTIASQLESSAKRQANQPTTVPPPTGLQTSKPYHAAGVVTTRLDLRDSNTTLIVETRSREQSSAGSNS